MHQLVLPYLVGAGPCHIPYPLYTWIVALLEDFEISHQEPRTCEHQEAEAQAKGRPRPGLLIRHAREIGLGAQDELALARKAANLPNDAVLARFVFCFALGAALGDASGVEWRRDADHDVRGKELATKIGLEPDTVLYFGLANFINDGVHLEW